MFNGNIKGTMELNELKLREIRQDISTRRLTKWVTDNNQKNIQNTNSYIRENDEQLTTVTRERLVFATILNIFIK